MTRTKGLAFLCILGALAAAVTFSVISSGGANATAQSIAAEAQGPLVMPVLRGDVWKKMTTDEKVAFIWGAGHIINLEQEIMDKHPEQKRDTFVTKASKTMSGMPINEVVAVIDKYYADHPADIDKPVIHVIWDTMIRPKIKSGIAGLPLSK